MKKLISVLLALLMFSFALAGCGSTPAANNDPAPAAGTGNEADTGGETASETAVAEEAASASGEQTVIRMSYWNDEAEYSKLLEYLAAAVPDVKIEFQFIDNTNYDTIIDTQLSAGEGPDIICESSGSALKHIRLGYLADLTELGQKFSAAGTSIYSMDGKIYALPGISWFEGIWYNKDIFAENNIALPTTFDEYIAVCKQFQDLGIKPLSAGLKSWEPMLKNSMALVTADYLSTGAGKDFGADYRDGNAALAGTWDPYIEKWSEMITSGVYTQDMSGIDHEQALEEFAAGGSAMFCSGPWDLEAILAKGPGLNLDMMPFYGTAPSEGWMIGGPGGGFAANANSKYPEAVMKVLEAIATPEAQLALWENNQGGSSYLIGATVELPEVYSGAKAALDAGNVFCPWDEWGTAAPAHHDYGIEFQKYLLGTQDIPTTLANVDTAVAELLSK